MTLTAKQFCIVKAGNYSEDYEDAGAVDLATRRFAIADGATESSFAREWASLLTKGFISDASYLSRVEKNRVNLDLFVDRLTILQAEWSKAIKWSKLTWFAEAKAREGAFASFLGLELKEPTLGEGQNEWSAIAVGDCDLFQVRGEALKSSFPLSHSVDFVNCPIILSSNPRRNQNVLESIRVKRGHWKNEDIFFLCTDALAKWSLTVLERGEKPWTRLRMVHRQQDFEYLVAELRDHYQVRNDDMTLITICDSQPGSLSKTQPMEVPDGLACTQRISRRSSKPSTSFP